MLNYNLDPDHNYYNSIINYWLTISKDFVKRVNKLIVDFTWSHKNPKIKKTMIGKRKEGGLGMPNFDIINKSLKAAWVKRLSAPDCAMWKSLPLDYLRDIGGKLIFDCNFSFKTLPQLSCLPLFYKDMLDAWQRIVAHTPLSKNDVENEVNNNTMTNGKVSLGFWKVMWK